MIAHLKHFENYFVHKSDANALLRSAKIFELLFCIYLLREIFPITNIFSKLMYY